jgi:hypothetical protein
MARNLYTRTMRSASSGELDGDAPENRPSHEPASARGPSREAAAPVIGKRTMYVDRQVKRRARARSKSQKIRKLQVLVAVLVLALIGFAMAWTFNYALVQKKDDQLLALDADLRRTKTELEGARSRLKERESEIAELVQGRVPGLRPILYNELLEVGEKYVVNLTFTESGVGEQKQLEFHTMLMNASDQMILPQLKIFLFDEFGVQAGMVELHKSFATGTAVLAELQPGETRSYHATIDVDRNATAKYFSLAVD